MDEISSISGATRLMLNGWNLQVDPRVLSAQGLYLGLKQHRRLQKKLGAPIWGEDHALLATDFLTLEQIGQTPVMTRSPWYPDS
jgi:hypothetical protein